MSEHANLTRQIDLRLVALQRTNLRRQQLRSAFLLRLEAPLLLLGGFCIGLVLQTSTSNIAGKNSTSAPKTLWRTPLSMCLWTLWHWRAVFAPAVPIRQTADNS
jgi:hypothetical protein